VTVLRLVALVESGRGPTLKVGGRQDLPTMVSKSKQELEMGQEGPVMRYTLPDKLMGKLSRAMAAHRQTTGLKKKLKKKSHHRSGDQPPEPLSRGHSGNGAR
jgi:hypothetical protein